MKNKYKRYLSLLCVSLMAFLCMYYHTGPAANGQAVTGAPFNGGTYCSSCHSGGTYGTTVSLQLLDASLNPVTSYTPGTNYTLKITITGTGTSTARYGFQVTSAYTDASNTNINGWGTSLPANTHNTLLNSRNYVEHSTQLTTNIINIPWTAPTGTNTNNIAFYAAGNIVNNDGTDLGDFANTASLTINAPCIIAISPSSLPNGTTGTSYNQTLTQTGGTGTITYSISAGSLPNGLSLSSAGTISGTPTASGTYNFTVAATNGSTCNGSQAYTIVINCPTITVNPTSLPAATAGNSYNTSITQTGGNGTATYAVTSGTLPTGLTLSSNGTLSGTPSGGTYTFTITATDANNCTGTRTYTLSPSCATATISPISLGASTVGSSYNQNITQTGGIGTFNYNATGTLPPGMTLSTAGVLSGTPTATGTYNFTVTGTNQFGCTTNSQAYSLAVNCPGITLNPTIATLTAGSAGTAYGPQSFTTTGGTGNSTTYAVTAGALPSGMTLSSAGVLSGTPSGGTYNFTVTATDNFLCTAVRAYSLNIACPTITLSPTTLPAGSPGSSYNQTISQTGGTGTVTYSVSTGTLPPGLTLSSTGTLSGTTTTAGTYNFTVSANSSFGCVGTQSYSIVVACPTVTVTPASLPSVVMGSAYNQTIGQTGGSGSYTYSVTTGSLPTGLSLSSAGVLAGTPTVSGTYNFTIAANNGFGCTGSQSYSIVVSCPSITVTPASIANINVGSTVNQTISQTGGTGTFTYSVTAGALPAGLTLSSAGILSGTATATGTYNFTVTASSGGCTGSTAYTVNVVCPTVTITPATLPNVPTGGSYSQNISQTGGNGTFTYAVTAGSLPAGLTLASNGLLSGSSTAAGSYNFTITGTSQYACSASQAYTVMVTCPTITLTATLPNSNIGVPYSQNIVATGGSGTTTYAITTGALPTGLTLASNGLLSGTPTANGTYNFTVTSTDGFGCTGSKSYTIIISCPSITLSALSTPTKGTPYNQTITQTGGNGTFTYAVTAGTLPTGLTLSSTGVLSGTPTATGTFSFTVTGTSSFGCTGVRTYIFNVTCPTITLSPTTLPGNNLGNAYNQTITQTGGNGTITYTITAGALPTGVSLSTAGVLSGNTTVNGTYNFTITATDAFGCTGSRAYTVTVSCPIITVTPTTLPGANVGTAYSQTITQTGSSNITYSISTGTLPTGLSLSPTTGLISGITTATGTFNFTVKATDAFGCNGSRAYTVVIGCPAITLSPTTLANANPGNTYNQTITQTGGLGTINYSISAGTLPTGLALSAAGVISGVPTVNGIYNFTVKATDSFGCTGTKAYVIAIACPTMTLSPATLPGAFLGATYNQSVTETGGTNTITYSVSTGSLPTGLSLSSTTGLISGTATANGTYNFTITAADGFGCSVSQAYTIVIACPTITVSPATLPSANVGSSYSQIISQSGATGTITYTVSAGTLPAGLSLSATTGAITGTATATGTYNFTVTATNPVGCTGSQAYTVTISCPSMTMSPSSLPNLSINTPFSQAITQTGATGTVTFSVSSGTLPTGLTLSSGGLLSGTTTASGNYNFTITATSNFGCSVSQAYSMIINCTIITLSPDLLPDANAGDFYNQTLTETGGVGAMTYGLLAGFTPPGTNLDPSTGTISGTMTTSGSYSFSVMATDQLGCVGYKGYTINVLCPNILLSPSSLVSGNEGSPYDQSITENGSTGSSVTYRVSSGVLPIGVTLSPDGVLSGTPSSLGDYDITITATDNFGCTASQSYILTIAAPVSVKTVGTNTEGISIVALLPNTVNNETTALITSGGNANTTVIVTDITGKIIMQDNVSLRTGSNHIKYDFSTLKAGIYIFRVSGSSEPIKFVKL